MQFQVTLWNGSGDATVTPTEEALQQLQELQELQKLQLPGENIKQLQIILGIYQLGESVLWSEVLVVWDI